MPVDPGAGFVHNPVKPAPKPTQKLLPVPKVPGLVPSPIAPLRPAKAPRVVAPARAKKSVVVIPGKKRGVSPEQFLQNERQSKVESYSQQIARGTLTEQGRQSLLHDFRQDPSIQDSINARVAQVNRQLIHEQNQSAKHMAGSIANFGLGLVGLDTKHVEYAALHPIARLQNKGPFAPIGHITINPGDRFPDDLGGGVYHGSKPISQPYWSVHKDGTPSFRPQGDIALPFGVPGGAVMDAFKAAKVAARAEKLKGVRTFTKAGEEGSQLTATLPVARSATGRVIQSAFDASRPVLSKLPGIMSEPEKAAQILGRNAKLHAKSMQARISVIQQLAHGLSDKDLHTITVIGAGLPAEERAALHAQWAADAASAGRSDQAAYHKLHMDANVHATRYTDVNAEGQAVLKAPGSMATKGDNEKLAKLTALYHAIENGVHKREDIYVNMGLLHDDAIAARVHGEGRVYRGARYKEIADIARTNLDALPARRQFIESMQSHGVSEQEQNAMIRVMDNAAIRKAQEMGNAEHVNIFWDNLLGVHDIRHDVPPEIERLYQGEHPTQPDMPAKIDAAKIARNVRTMKHPLPDELLGKGKLTAAIHAVYELAKEGAPYRDWYSRAAQQVKQVAEWEGYTPKEVAQLTAIYSQTANPTANMAFVVKALREFKATGKIESLGAGGEAQRAKAEAVLKGSDWKGRKTNSFYSNIAKHGIEQFPEGHKPVTVDRWVVRMFAPKSEKITPGTHYAAMEHIIQQMADQLGWHPEEVQAAAWVTAKSRNLLERYPQWSEAKAVREAGDAYEAGVAKHGAQTQLDLAGAGAIPEKLKAPQPHADIVQTKVDATKGRDLKGLPQNVKYADGTVTFHSSKDVQDIASGYMQDAKLPYDPPTAYATVDRGRAARIAKLYEEAQHSPANPEVMRAYDAMIQETLDQYRALEKAGYKFEFYPAHDPYPGGPRDSMLDITQNKHMYVFPTEGAFGTVNETLDHPLLSHSGIEWGGKPVTHNDLFRAVHDVFGHAKEGVGFRADGEENAWRSHSAMYSPEARRAMTSETRGQNSWVNFGPHGAKNRVASQEGTVYADQKAVLLPEWVTTEGAKSVGSYASATDKYQALVAKVARDAGGIKPNQRLSKGAYADAERHLHEWAAAHPDSTEAQQFHALHDRMLAESPKAPEPDELFSREGFHEDAAKAMEEYAALARDIARTLPEEDWPQWVHNQLRLQSVGPDKPIHIPTGDVPDTIPPEWLTQGDAVRANDSFIRDVLKDHPAALKAYTDGLAAGGIAPWEKGAFAAMRELPLVSQAREDIFGLIKKSSPLFQKDELAVAKNFAKTPGVKGMISFPSGGGSVIWTNARTDTTTFAHEMSHYIRRFVADDREQLVIGRHTGATPIREQSGRVLKSGQRAYRIVGYTHTVESEENFARQFEAYLRSGRAPNSSLTRAFKTLGKRFREDYQPGYLPDLDPQMAKLFDRLLSPSKITGGRLEGGTGWSGGRIRIPQERGVPTSGLKSKAQAINSYVRSMGDVFALPRKGAAVGAPQDSALTHAYKGYLPLTGRFKINPVKAIVRDLTIAMRVSTADYVRRGLLAGAKDLPQAVDDIPIKVDPRKGVKGGAITDLLEKMEHANATEADLKNIDWQEAEAIRSTFLPHDIEGLKPEAAAYRAMQDQKPVDNVKWIPRGMVDATGAFYVPSTNKGLRVLGNITTGVNDIQKAMILYLNPAYIPVNLVGNGVMNMMQQGVWLPKNFHAAVTAHSWLDPLERVYMDQLMGEGLTQSLSFKSAPGKIIHATLGHYINLAVDLLPRRAAFLHEARVMGYKDGAAVKKLLQDGLNGDQKALDDLNRIQHQANNAIVDYDKMTPFEREVVSRIVFFYPWLKGATRYTADFAMQHPLQAAGIALAMDNAYVSANQILHDRPSYAVEDVPLSTRSVGLAFPGISKHLSLDQVVGVHTARENGMPLEISARQLLTFTTPLELFQAGIGFAQGDPNAPGIVQNLVPVLYAAGVAGFGFDPFRNKQVNPGVKTFLSQLEPQNAMPLVSRIQAATMSKEQRKSFQNRALNPRTQMEDLERIFGGALTPQPYNPEIGAERVHSSDPVWRLEHDSQGVGLGKVPPLVLNELQVHRDLGHALHKGDTPVTKVQAALPIYVKATGDHSFDRDVKSVTDYAEATAIYLAMRKILFANLNAWQTEVDKLKSAKAEAASASGG